MLTINNITYNVNDKDLFKNLSFTIGERTILSIKGENGSGKTSLLNVIACVKLPQSGEILYSNVKIDYKTRNEYFSLINFIEHNDAINQDLTVYENMKFWSDIRDSEQSIDAALSFFDLEEYRNIECKKLSQGQKKKVSLTRLMLYQSKIWLLDEPFVNLDKNFKIKLRELIKVKADNLGVIIFTSHEDVKIEDSIEILLSDFSDVCDLK